MLIVPPLFWDGVGGASLCCDASAASARASSAVSGVSVSSSRRRVSRDVSWSAVSFDRPSGIRCCASSVSESYAPPASLADMSGLGRVTVFFADVSAAGAEFLLGGRTFPQSPAGGMPR
ncbi:MAG TPA: hypothetical protein VFF43_07535 [Caldimonas sp.]|nr:hypothetical protein [Caldimonas sp.]